MNLDLIDALQDMKTDMEKITTDAIVLSPDEFKDKEDSALCQDIADNAIKAKEIFEKLEGKK